MPSISSSPKNAPTDHPSGDVRFKLIGRTLKRFQYQQDSLIEVLHTAQEAFGFLDHDVLLYAARHLKLPLSQVYGVATFYHFFSLKPQGWLLTIPGVNFEHGMGFSNLSRLSIDIALAQAPQWLKIIQ